MRSLFLTLGCLFLALTWLPAQDQKTPKKKFQGDYIIVAGQENGKAIPREKYAGAIVHIDSQKIFGMDKDKKEFFAASYQLDTQKEPYKIRMVSTSPKKGEKVSGTVEFKEGKVHLCYTLEGDEVPADVKADTLRHCFVLERISPK